MQFEQKLMQSHTKENIDNIKNDLFFLQGKNMVKTWEVNGIINGVVARNRCVEEKKNNQWSLMRRWKVSSKIILCQGSKICHFLHKSP